MQSLALNKTEQADEGETTNRGLLTDRYLKA